MAEVVFPEHVPGHGATLGSIDMQGNNAVSENGTQQSARSSQPRAPLWNWQSEPVAINRRPASASMRIDIPAANPASAHTRAASVLPSFSFNASDISGLRDSHTPPRSPEEATATSPSRTSHRRGGSEFIGGDSRRGVSNALSSSPQKINPTSDLNAPGTIPLPARRGHAHRRSAAISSNDIVKLMQPANEGQSRLSSSLPNSPLDYPSSVSTEPFASTNDISDPFGPPLESLPARPQSKPRVGFSDNVEFIPRPLSTISSETESSMSTIRGHSVNTSISSLLSLSTSSPQASRTPRLPVRNHSADDVKPPVTLSPVKPRRVEKEGHWLKRESSESLKRPMSESAVHPKTTFADPEPIARSGKRSVSHALRLDRRRSEPSFSLGLNEPSRLSAISLQEASSAYGERDPQEQRELEHKSSVRRMKEWATAKISKKAKEASRALTSSSSSSSLRPVSAGSNPLPAKERPEHPVAETDLDAVLSHPEAGGHSDRLSNPSQALVGINAAVSSQYSGSNLHSYDDSEAVLDLDAALGPFKTPPIGSHRHRKEMHSSRLTKDFAGLSGHYHRRAESAPNLAPFEYQQAGNASPPGMADVFEEEEEDAPNASADRASPASDAGIWNEASHAAVAYQSSTESSPRGFPFQDIVEIERPPFSFGHNRPVLSSLVLEGRGTSIIEETILEEGSPRARGIEIVDAEEEPRASSPTKSSDSSDTPTVLIPPSGGLPSSYSNQMLAAPEAYQTSSYSSPIIRPGSLSSYNTGDQSQDMRLSVEVPSLVSSRSTMMSTIHDNGSRRDVGEMERAISGTPHPPALATANDMRRKRGSIQSLSQLVGGTFGSRFGGSSYDLRPQTAGDTAAKAAVKKDNRLKKLMFWKTRRTSRQGFVTEQ